MLAAFSPTYIRTGIFTIPSFLKSVMMFARGSSFSGFIIVICIMTKMAFTLFAGRLVLHSLAGWDIMTTVAVLAFLAAAVTMIGGFAAVAYTDAIQATVVIVGCAIMTVMGLGKVGGWGV